MQHQPLTFSQSFDLGWFMLMQYYDEFGIIPRRLYREEWDIVWQLHEEGEDVYEAVVAILKVGKEHAKEYLREISNSS